MDLFDDELPPSDFDALFEPSPMARSGPSPAHPVPGPPQLSPGQMPGSLGPSASQGPPMPPVMQGAPMVPMLPPPEMMHPQMMMMPPPVAFGQPLPPTALENGHTLGLAVLLSGIGSAAGLVYGGLFGGIAGGLAGGSAVNLLRAYRHVVKGTPEDDREATISATYGVLGLGASLFLFYKARSSPRPNEPQPEASSTLRGMR